MRGAPPSPGRQIVRETYRRGLRVVGRGPPRTLDDDATDKPENLQDQATLAAELGFDAKYLD